MLLIDFSETPKKAFARGFIKGLAAPMVLFGNYHAPILTDIKWVTPPKESTDQALVNDWIKIGGDINRVIYLHGQTAQEHKPTSK
jgi:hypothetical protein